MASTTCLRYNEPMYLNVWYVYQIHACEDNESAWEQLMNRIICEHSHAAGISVWIDVESGGILLK